MDDQERDRQLRDRMKYNEFHKGGQKEDRTTAEIVEIATALEDGASIHCMAWLWPNMRLGIILNNQLQRGILDIELVVSNADLYNFRLKRHGGGGIQRRKGGPWRNDFDMTISDVVECFGLDDQKIKNPDPPTPGTWTGWFLLNYRGPKPDDPAH